MHIYIIIYPWMRMIPWTGNCMASYYLVVSCVAAGCFAWLGNATPGNIYANSSACICRFGCPITGLVLLEIHILGDTFLVLRLCPTNPNVQTWCSNVVGLYIPPFIPSRFDQTFSIWVRSHLLDVPPNPPGNFCGIIVPFVSVGLTANPEKKKLQCSSWIKNYYQKLLSCRFIMIYIQSCGGFPITLVVPPNQRFPGTRASSLPGSIPSTSVWYRGQ